MNLEPTGLRVSTPTGLRVSVNAFILHDGKILLQRRSDNGNWNMPGGGVEIGESLITALHREVFEETGLLAQITRYIGVYSDPLETAALLPAPELVATPAPSSALLEARATFHAN